MKSREFKPSLSKRVTIGREIFGYYLENYLMKIYSVTAPDILMPLLSITAQKPVVFCLRRAKGAAEINLGTGL